MWCNGCATVPTYSVRPPQAPNERADIVNLERTLSATQAQQLESQVALYDVSIARGKGFDVEGVARKLASVSERPQLYYRCLVLGSSAPNAVALADGRVYLTLGMLDYLKARGSREDELAFVIGHEIGHICAQHLVQNVQQLQRRQMAMTVIGPLAGALIGAATTSRYSPYYTYNTQMGGYYGQLAAQAINQVQAQGFSQEQELVADQLALRYMMKAGYHPEAAIPLLEDLNRFQFYGPFLQTHPPFPRRAEDVRRFLAEMQAHGGTPINAQGQAPSGVPASATEWRWVQYASTPQGASIEVNGIPNCVTPCTDFLWYQNNAQLVVTASHPTLGLRAQIIDVPPIPETIKFDFSTPIESTVVLGVAIVGSAKFVSDVKHALALLQTRAPDAFSLVRQHFDRIVGSNAGLPNAVGLPAGGEGPTLLALTDQNGWWPSDTMGAAMVAVYAYGVKLRGNRNLSGVTDHERDDMMKEAGNYGLAVLREVGAPQSEIDQMQTGFNPYLQSGAAYQQQGNLPQAIADYTKAIELTPPGAKAYAPRGLAYGQQGNLPQAISDCTKAIELDPHLARAYAYRGGAYCEAKEYDKAWADVHQAAALGFAVPPDVLSALQKASGRDH